jgi:putative transposase
MRGKPTLTLRDLSECFGRFLCETYHVRVQNETGTTPNDRWEANGFLPRMADSLEQLDLLLITVVRSRKVHPDGIHFLGMRYIDPNLAAYVGESVILRYDPRDVAEVRVFQQDRFLCRAVCQELAGETVPLREVLQARNRRRRDLKQTLADRQRVVDTLLQVRRWNTEDGKDEPPVASALPALKRYINE